jgi:hypothetical protein
VVILLSNIYMALACQEKTSPIDRKMLKKTNFRLNP